MIIHPGCMLLGFSFLLMQYQIVVPPMMAQISPSPTINPFAPLAGQENPICGYISANLCMFLKIIALG